MEQPVGEPQKVAGTAEGAQDQPEAAVEQEAAAPAADAAAPDAAAGAAADAGAAAAPAAAPPAADAPAEADAPPQEQPPAAAARAAAAGEPDLQLPGPPPMGGPANGGAGGAPKRTAEDAGLGGGGDRPSKALRMDGLEPAVAEKMRALVDSGAIAASDVEGSTSDTLRKLDAASGIELLEALAGAGLAAAPDGAARRAMVVVTVARFAQRVRPDVDPQVRAKLEALYVTAGGPLKPGDLDARCVERLGELPVATSLAVLDVFSQKKFDFVRNVSALFMTTLKRVMSGEEGPGAMGGYGGGYAAPPAYAAPYQQQPYGAAPGGFPAPPGAGGFPGLPPAPGVPGMRVNHGAEQAAAGVRVGEFHALNPNAACVAPQAALRLQQLWDGGNELVSLLDDKAWEGLSQLGAAEALSLVDETGGKLAAGQIRNVNAFIMSVARRMIQEAAMAPRYGAPPAGGAGGALYLLTPTLKATVEDMCRRHHPYLQLHHFDQSAASMLMRIGERDALIILGELDRTSMESIRSMPAFIMGMVKRHTGR